MGIPAEEFFGEQTKKQKETISAEEFSAGGPIEVSQPEEISFGERAAEIPKQFIAGLDDITALLAKPLQAAFGTISIGAEGIEFLSPEETAQRREEGLLGIPGRAREEPTSLVGKGVRFAGQTLAAGPILGRAAGFVKPVAPAATKLGRIRQLPRKIAAEAGKTFARSPVSVTAAEAGLGFTAGAGGFIAEKIFPDSDAAVFVGEIIGGVTPALMPIRVLSRAGGGARNIVQKFRAPFTPEGGRKRAAARIQRAGTPEQRAEALQELELPTTLDPETGLPVLTPVQRTGAPGLLSLERAVMESSEELKRAGDVSIANANTVIQKSLTDIAGQPTVPVVVAQDYMANLLDTRLRIAAQRTDERIAELGPKASREQLNRIADDEIDKALEAATAQERQLFNAIPDETAVPFSQSKAKFDEFFKQLGKAQQGDIPVIAKRFLSKKSVDYFGKKVPKGFESNETSIKELRALQSKLRQVARNARAGDKKNLNKARISDDIANSITKDIENTRAGKEVADNVKLAVDFSREKNNRFGSGTMAKILGKRATGAEKVPAGLTLEESIGVTGPKAREALDDLVKAFDSPEAPGSEILIDAGEDFLRFRFLKSAVDRGQLNVRTARRFLQQNEEILNRLPSVRHQINEVIESGETLAITQRLRDPKLSKAAMLIEKGPVETFRQINKMRPKDAAKEVQQLVNRVSKDETGEALLGLKSGFIEFLYSTSRESARDVQGLRFVSGFAMRETMDSMSASTKRLFSADELKRINVITDDLVRIEKRRAAQTAPEGVISDLPGRVVSVLSMVSGARFGSLVSRQVGGGGIQIPHIFSKQFRQLTEAGVRDPSARLIRDAIFDEDLFKELLQSNLEEGGTALSKIATGRLNAWMATALAEYGGVFDEEDTEDIR